MNYNTMILNNPHTHEIFINPAPQPKASCVKSRLSAVCDVH